MKQDIEKWLEKNIKTAKVLIDRAKTDAINIEKIFFTTLSVFITAKKTGTSKKYNQPLASKNNWL